MLKKCIGLRKQFDYEYEASEDVNSRTPAVPQRLVGGDGGVETRTSSLHSLDSCNSPRD